MAKPPVVTREDGFTLIELLIAIAISGIIIGAVATGFLVTMAGSQNVHERFLESHDAQRLSTYFQTDVQSANPTTVNPTTTGCGGTMTGTQILRLDWSETDATTKTVFSASYRFNNSTSGSTLTRYFCSNSGSTTADSGTLLGAATATSRVVATNLADSAVQTPYQVNLANLPRIDITLYSNRSTSEQRAGIPVYSYTLSAAMRSASTVSTTTTTMAPTTTTTMAPTTTTTMAPTTTTTTIDTTPPPNPSVSGAKVSNNQVDITFSDSESGVSFECQFDGGTFSACTSVKHYGPGSTYAGSHDYGVRAVDSAGNRSGTVTVTVSA